MTAWPPIMRNRIPVIEQGTTEDFKRSVLACVARSYCQNCGTPRVMGDIEECRHGCGFWYKSQWGEDEWEPIVGRVERVALEQDSGRYPMRDSDVALASARWRESLSST